MFIEFGIFQQIVRVDLSRISVFLPVLTFSEKQLTIEKDEQMFLLAFGNFKTILYIILNQKFTSIKKFRSETATYSYQAEKIF